MKKIKLVTITLVIIAITMIAFFGVYVQKQNRVENKVKDFSYAMDIEGSRNIRLKVNDDNSEEVKNIENYKASKELIEKRLEKSNVDNYNIKLDEQTGDIVIELSENDTTDRVISNITTTGKFEILDTKTNEVLMGNNDIQTAKVMYGAADATSNGTSVYLDIQFNKEGTKKLEELTSKYVTVEQDENEEHEQDEEENTITMKIDDEEIMSTSFEEPIKTGKFQLSIGAVATDAKTLQQNIDSATNMSIVLDTGRIPVKYDLTENQYVLSDITEDKIQIAEYIVLGIIAIGLIVFIIRYKTLGIIGSISYIGFVSLLILVIKYTNVIVSIEGFLGIIIAFLLNYILVNKLLVKTNKKEVYKEFFIKIIPVITLSIIFSFINWTPISSFGMVMFWGIALIAVYNLLLTDYLLKLKVGKEK